MRESIERPSKENKRSDGKKKFIHRRKREKKDIELINSMMQARVDLNIANRNFESAEEELIDYYSYQIKAYKSKLDYLIKKVKEKGIVFDMINDLEFRIHQRKVI